MKYKAYVDCLEDYEVYCAASIVDHAIEKGLHDPEQTHLRKKVRQAMASLSQCYQFPHKGDAWVELPGKSLQRGWHGWRWKAAAERKEKRLPRLGWDPQPPRGRKKGDA